MGIFLILGVKILARMVWGTYLEKNYPSSNGHLLVVEGQDAYQDGLGHFFREGFDNLSEW